LLTEQAQRLGKELAEVESELERVAAAEQVVAQLLAEQEARTDSSDGGHSAGRPAAPPSRPPRPALAVPHRAEGTGVEDLPTDYRRIMAIVAEEGLVGQGVTCKRGVRQARPDRRAAAYRGGPGEAQAAGRAGLAHRDRAGPVRPALVICS
jgi:hypothetical protein